MTNGDRWKVEALLGAFDEDLRRTRGLCEGTRGNYTGDVGWVGSWRCDADAFRFQPPPVEPCMRFSRTRLTDALHLRCSTGARQARLGLGAATIPLRETSPNVSRDR